MLSYLKQKLNEEQYEASIHNDTSSLILAWAWSWKTRTVTYKIAYLIFLWVDPRKIFGVTFTNKAANELKERLIEITKEVKQLWLLANAIPLNYLSFKRIWTFHWLFLKILKEDIEELDLWYTKDFTIYDSWETMSIVKKIINNHNLKWLIEPKEARGMISKMKNEWMTYEKFAISTWQKPFDIALATIYKDYQKQLRTSNCLDFDDLLLLPYLLFAKNTEVLEKRQNNFEYIMVDEAQDTNRIQFELMQKLWWKNTKLTFIWDDYQSIYGRRWAVMDNFLNLKKYRPDIKMFKLQTNYRSKPHIVEAWNFIIKKNTKQYDKTVNAHREWEEKIVVFNHHSDLQEAINTIDFIAQTREKKTKKWSDFAILYRTNAQSSVFERVLIQQGIPYRIFWAFKFFERAEVKDIVSYLKFLNNPKDDISLLRIINVPKRWIWKTTIEKIQKYATDNNSSMYEVLLSLHQIDVWINSWKQKDLYNFWQVIFARKEFMQTHYPAELIVKIVSDINYKNYLIKEEWKEKWQEKFENIGQLINMAEKYQDDDNPEKENDDFYISKTKLFLEEIALMTDVAEKDINTVDAIKLMTIHSSKWLEFPFVFITWLEEWVFPLSNASLDPRELEEERRLMYVAITRAKDHLFLSFADSRMQRWQIKNNPPSRFLSELPEDLLKKYELWWWPWSFAQSWPDLDIEDKVKHKLFGIWEVMEVWKWVCIVRFNNPKFGVRKIETRYLELIW